MKQNTFTKQERLKSKKLIGQLFEKGSSISEFPLRLSYLQVKPDSKAVIQAGFSAPKKKIKKAVHRNRIKRLMRETYRLNKQILYKNLNDPYILMFTYIDEKEQNYVDIEEKMILLLRKFIQNIKNRVK